MKTLKIVAITVLVALITACGGFNSGSRSSEPVAYLYFTGNPEGVEVTVGGSPAFVVQQYGERNKFRVSPGKHLITIRKAGKIIVKREVLLGDEQAKEFYIP